MQGLIEDGTTILYEVYKGTKKAGELKRLQPGIEMIKAMCEKHGFSISDYSIILISSREVVWSGFNKPDETPYSY